MVKGKRWRRKKTTISKGEGMSYWEHMKRKTSYIQSISLRPGLKLTGRYHLHAD